MGHSLGAGIVAWFSGCFPDRVERLIMMDLIAFGPVPLKKHAKYTRKAIEQTIRIIDTLDKSTDASIPR